MKPTLALLLTLGMSVVPTLLFLGLWRGLMRMQESELVQNSLDRVENMSQLRSDGCDSCGTVNAEFASYCRECDAKLS